MSNEKWTFRNQAFKDLEDVFFFEEREEFTKKVTIASIGYNGRKTNEKECLVIIDNDKFLERNIKDEIQNIYVGGLLFFVKKDDLGFMPERESTLYFDGKLYQIDSVNDDFGILEVTLMANYEV